jgi:predicted nucleotidyltransferase
VTHLTFSRRGGKARSAAKTAANRKKAKAYWKAVRAGALPPPQRRRTPPSPETISRQLTSFCRRHGIMRLEIFGSLARDEARQGSDVDLLVTFRRNPGLGFFAMENEMAVVLGVPVHLLTRESVEEMTNRLRRDAILREARIIYDA